MARLVRLVGHAAPVGRELPELFVERGSRFLESHREYIDVSNFTTATPLPGTDLYDDALKNHPELADRSVVKHPAFSLFTALAPTRMEPPEFYVQVARVHKGANQFELDWTALENLSRVVVRSPWLLPKILRMPSHLRNLTRPEMFLHTHREAQGGRLLA